MLFSLENISLGPVTRVGVHTLLVFPISFVFVMWPGHGAAFPWWCLTWVSRLPQAGLAQELLCLSMAMALASKVLSLITFAWNSKNLHLASYLFQCLWIQLLGSPDILEKPYRFLFVTFLTFLCCDLRISSSCFWGGGDGGGLLSSSL